MHHFKLLFFIVLVISVVDNSNLSFTSVAQWTSLVLIIIGRKFDPRYGRLFFAVFMSQFHVSQEVFVKVTDERFNCQESILKCQTSFSLIKRYI